MLDRYFLSPESSSSCSEDLNDQEECFGKCQDNKRASSMGFGHSQSRSNAGLFLTPKQLLNA